MSNRKVSELNEASSLGLNDLIMIVQNGTNKKIKSSNFLNVLINNKGTLTGTNLTANDSADNKIDKFEIKGNSIQNGTPSPSNKVEIQSAGDNDSIDIEICRKNICSTDFNEWESGHYDGTTGEKTPYDARLRTKRLIRVEPNKTYYAKTDKYYMILRAYNSSMEIVRNIGSIDTLSGTTFETSSNEEFISISLYQDTNYEAFKSNWSQVKPLICLNSESNKNFEEYEGQTYSITTQQPFRAIGNYKDEFIRQNGKWYEKHYIGETVLNGSEDYSWASSLKENTLLRNLNIKSNDIQETGYILCDYYVERGNSDAVNYDYAISRYGATSTYNYEKLVFRNKDMTSANDFKTWLSTHNVTVDYILETPTLIECTQEQTIQLNEIASLARTYSPTTHIFSNDEVSPNMEVTYFKDVLSLLS